MKKTFVTKFICLTEIKKAGHTETVLNVFAGNVVYIRTETSNRT